ncbi:MAG: 3-methyl-2-oxobutanoate hydroxymethyltransferase [Planctomycetes bacterium]|nr:3-methyl-2-oxobutanoate hydroxymethyltransferase [Planctomycetota bacterium]
MSHLAGPENNHPGKDKVTTTGLKTRKLAGEKITALTAFDCLGASILEEAGVDLILVGDSLANTSLGYETTLPVSMEEMLSAVRAVKRGSSRAMLVADMPFGSYQASIEDALANAVAFLKAGAEAVKIERGASRAPLAAELDANGIPVMGHIGLTPQSVHVMGGYKVQGKEPEDARRLLDDALALEEAGVFSLVLEGMPAALAARITGALEIPTIGIGAGSDCDGQILVFSDLLGLSVGKKPKFVRQYAQLRSIALEAIESYCRDVREGYFPSASETYGNIPEKHTEKPA